MFLCSFFVCVCLCVSVCVCVCVSYMFMMQYNIGGVSATLSCVDFMDVITGDMSI